MQRKWLRLSHEQGHLQPGAHWGQGAGTQDRASSSSCMVCYMALVKEGAADCPGCRLGGIWASVALFPSPQGSGEALCQEHATDQQVCPTDVTSVRKEHGQRLGGNVIVLQGSSCPRVAPWGSSDAWGWGSFSCCSTHYPQSRAYLALAVCLRGFCAALDGKRRRSTCVDPGEGIYLPRPQGER